MLGMTADSGLV